jgi:hypothetical protein
MMSFEEDGIYFLLLKDVKRHRKKGNLTPEFGKNGLE